jgi:hypothetical protein
MFCNTYILFCDFFMCKVLGLKFFLLQSKDLFIVFYLGLELETNQAFQPLAPPCPFNMA